MTNPTMSSLDELIEAERKRAAEKIAKLKRAAAAEQRRIEERVVALLREQNADLYKKLASRARGALADEKAKRSTRAKKSVTPTSTVHDQHASRDDDHGEEVSGSWQ
ncbi:hypothetical protein [Mycetocola reblochoni]|uniref:hypothetical protein n=1 Tax=Mycetocola reblochoni TaxID=331618 RepID=UPI003F95CF17